MVRSVRNLGWRGICATAISAVDVALWDLKARLLDRPLVQLLGATRSAVPIYGSGGFTSYSTGHARRPGTGRTRLSANPAPPVFHPRNILPPRGTIFQQRSGSPSRRPSSPAPTRE
jgi:L-alanine-DL-glutamate epimerase-like enolase superfamily enzyme